MSKHEKFGFEKFEKREKTKNVYTLISEERYSQIKKSIQTPVGLRSFEKWRTLDNIGREARQSRKIFELAAAARAVIQKYPKRKKEVVQVLSDKLDFQKDMSSRPLTDQFQAAVLFEALGIKGSEVSTTVSNLVNGCKKLESTEGELNVIKLLSSSHVNPELKQDWVRAHVLPRLLFLAHKDKEKAKELPPIPERTPKKSKKRKGKKEKAQASSLPPPEQDSMYTMEEDTEKKEGEPMAYFTVSPFYGGYYRGQTFDAYDIKAQKWYRSEKTKFSKAEDVNVNEKKTLVMQGIVAGHGSTRIPCPYNFALLPQTLKIGEKIKAEIWQDEDGGCVLNIIEAKKGSAPFSIEMNKRARELEPQKPDEPAQWIEPFFWMREGDVIFFREETIDVLEELRNNKDLTSIDKARHLKQYVKGFLEYSTKFSHKSFFDLEKSKKADCDTANTYFIALVSSLGIPARMVSGHYVKVKDNKGRAMLSASTAHAWAEVWDEEHKKWMRLDATPPGDPTMDKEEMDEKQDDKDFEGDYGGADILSDKDLKKLIDEVKRIQQEQEKELNPKEKRILNFADEVGCTEEEAREIILQIDRARALKDKQGRNILDQLTAEFIKIVKQNLKEIPSYRAPVRLPEADELEDPVEVLLDIISGEPEPSGFKKYEHYIEKIQEYGGFDVFFVQDKSESMAANDPVSGRPKYKEQQAGNFLLNEALHKFSDYTKKYNIKLISPLNVRFSNIGFQDDRAYAFLPLGDKWGPKEQYTVWKQSGENIGGGTPDNLGLRVAREMIENDIEQMEDKGKDIKKRLRLVIVLADGGTDSDKVEDREVEKKKLTEMGVVVAGLGLGEAGKEMKASYHPNGDWVESVGDMPAWVAQQVIKQVRKLYPKKIRT